MKSLFILLIAILQSGCMTKKENFDHAVLGRGLKLELTNSWVGKEVSSFIQIKDISKTILLKAITSAPAEIDLDYIVKTLKNSTKFEWRDKLSLSNNVIWQAVLLTRDGSYFYYQSDGHWIHLGSENGGGFFKSNL